MYALMCQQMQALLDGCNLPLPSLANCAALLWEHLKDVNWAGFYLLKGENLYLGPFQGKIACTKIPLGKGVCGTAAVLQQIQLVPDVHQFPGHIACDSASNSEIVLPIFHAGRLIGVMDIDSPQLNRFSQEDAVGLDQLCKILETSVCWEDGLL